MITLPLAAHGHVVCLLGCSCSTKSYRSLATFVLFNRTILSTYTNIQSYRFYVVITCLQVSTDGYLSFGRPITCCPSLTSDSSNSDYIVAPFEADTNIASGRGQVSYEVHTNSTSPAQLSRVNSFIRQQKQSSFAGTWMLVAEWKDVPQSGQSDNNMVLLED